MQARPYDETVPPTASESAEQDAVRITISHHHQSLMHLYRALVRHPAQDAVSEVDAAGGQALVDAELAAGVPLSREPAAAVPPKPPAVERGAEDADEERQCRRILCRGVRTLSRLRYAP